MHMNQYGGKNFIKDGGVIGQKDMHTNDQTKTKTKTKK